MPALLEYINDKPTFNVVQEKSILIIWVKNYSNCAESFVLKYVVVGSWASPVVVYFFFQPFRFKCYRLRINGFDTIDTCIVMVKYFSE